ncbi:MAG: 2-dehydropantoate 2-reductase N-terminal domain-containing protein [Lysobacteraceae bacterium]
MKRITVAGAGYVGLSNAVMLARQHAVTILDIDAARIEAIRQRTSPISDPDIERQLRDESLHLATSTDPGQALAGADFVFIATPTNYDPHSNQFDTESVQSVVRAAMTLCPEALIVIKSTVPVGFTEAL